jgi:hypothetical protein
VGKELYSVTTDVLSAEGANYVLSMTEAAKPWNQRNYYEFVKNYRFPEHNELKIFQVFEIPVRQPRKLEIRPDILIRPAEKYDDQRISRFFELFCSKMERDACDLNLNDLRLKGLNEEMRPHGLVRGRDLLVAMHANRLVGIARVEFGTYGQNIFGLQDTLYVHVWPGIQGVSEDAYEALVEGGLRAFQDLGRHTVIVLLDDGRPAFYKDKGLPYLWEGVRWIGNCVAARRYQAYTQMLYGHLLFQRENIRRHRGKTGVK